MFDHFGIVCENGTHGTMLQIFGIKIMVKAEYVQNKLGRISQEKFSKEIEDLQFNSVAKDEEISKLQVII